MSYLYVLKCNEFYKVGIAADVASRVSGLQTGNPYPLEVFAYYEFDNPSPVEQSIHQRFASKWKAGEWFMLDVDDLATMNQICVLLGGKRQAGEIEVAEQVEDDEAPVSLADVEKMFSEGWRIEVNGSGARCGKYFTWRRGSGPHRESRYGGFFSDLPKERQEEYYRNKARQNGAGGKVEP